MAAPHQGCAQRETDIPLDMNGIAAKTTMLSLQIKDNGRASAESEPGRLYGRVNPDLGTRILLTD